MWATVRAPDGWEYTFTDEDYLWACRMLMGEIEGSADTWEAYAHLWAMLNRLYRLRLWPNYTGLIRVFSTPIDPTSPQTPRRDRIQSLPLEEIPAGVRRRVADFMQGKIPEGEYQGIEFFGACNEASSIPHGTPDIVGPSGQCYYKPPEGVVSPPSLAWSTAPASRGYMRAGFGILLGVLLVGVAVGMVREHYKTMRQGRR
jgi:hypothetical protein